MKSNCILPTNVVRACTWYATVGKATNYSYILCEFDSEFGIHLRDETLATRYVPVLSRSTLLTETES